MARITLLHTSDLHGRLSAAAAERIQGLKLESAPALLLDAGDAVSAGNVGVRLRGEVVLRRMARAGYDALAMGNREFHPWRSLLRKKLNDAQFAVLCANIIEPRPKPIEPYRIFCAGDLQVGVFGLCVPMIPRAHWARRISPFVFEDPLEAAAQLVPQIRQEAQVVIALTHIGIEMDRRLAASVPGIDLILGGHSHIPMEAAHGNNPAILHPAPCGREICRAVIDSDGNTVSLISWDRIPLDGLEGD